MTTADPAQLHNELERLGDIARQLHAETWNWTVKERYSGEVVAAHRAIEDRLVAAGHSRDVAGEVVATWIILGRSRTPEWSVLGCVGFFHEHIEPILQRQRDGRAGDHLADPELRP